MNSTIDEEAQETEAEKAAVRSLESAIFIRLLRAKLNADRYENYYQSIYKGERNAN